jgi:trans-aconitate methyltransferase
MISNEKTAREIFINVHEGLPRQGPGLSRQYAARFSAMRIKDIAQSPLNLLDISCRPGLQTRQFAEVFHQANITAIDTHEPF